MSTRRHRGSGILAFALAMGLSQSSLALDVEVGRASVKTSGEGWSVLAQEDKGQAYTGEVQGVIQSETKVLLKGMAPDSLQALVLVRASTGGMNYGYMQYSSECKPSNGWHAKGNSAPSQPFLECYKIGQNWPAEQSLRAIAPKLFETLGDRTQQLPRAWTPIVAFYANSNGSFVEVRLFVTPELIAASDAPVTDVPRGLDPKYVQLAEALMDGVRGSVRSMSGKLPIPEMRFGPAPPPEKRLALATTPRQSPIADH